MLTIHSHGRFARKKLPASSDNPILNSSISPGALFQNPAFALIANPVPTKGRFSVSRAIGKRDVRARSADLRRATTAPRRRGRVRSGVPLPPGSRRRETWILTATMRLKSSKAACSLGGAAIATSTGNVAARCASARRASGADCARGAATKRGVRGIREAFGPPGGRACRAPRAACAGLAPDGFPALRVLLDAVDAYN